MRVYAEIVAMITHAEGAFFRQIHQMSAVADFGLKSPLLPPLTSDTQKGGGS